MKKITFIISILYVCFFSAAFIYAADVQGALSPVQQASVGTAVPSQPPAPASPTSENVYNYNPLGKPDPFKPLLRWS